MFSVLATKPIDDELTVPDKKPSEALAVPVTVKPAWAKTSPVASIEFADKTNLAVEPPRSDPEVFEVGTIAVVLIVTPVVVCEAAFTTPV